VAGRKRSNSVYRDAVKIAMKTRTEEGQEMSGNKEGCLTGAIEAAKKTHGVAYESYCRAKRKAAMASVPYRFKKWRRKIFVAVYGQKGGK